MLLYIDVGVLRTTPATSDINTQKHMHRYLKTTYEYATAGINGLLIIAILYTAAMPTQVLAFVDTVRTPFYTPFLFTTPEAYASHIASGIDLDALPNIGPVSEGMTIKTLAAAYTSRAEETDGNPFRTAMGTQTRSGIIAANFLPFGSVVQINGTQYTVEDRMNARYNSKFIIDIWMPSLEQALQFGVRPVNMTIVHIP